MARDDPGKSEKARAGESLARRIDAFRERRPLRTATIDGVSWSYRCSPAGGGPLILLLSGALGQGDFAFTAIEALEAEASVLAPDYPALPDLARLSAGLAGLIDREGAQRAHVVGGSFGGVVAQAFAREHPDRIASLVLSHCGAPRRAPGRRGAVALLRLLPAAALRALMAKRLRPALRKAEPFWAREFERSLGALSRRDILARVALAADFGRRYGGTAPPQAAWPVLIIDSDDDPLFSDMDRAALLASYPGAEHRRFRGTGHIASLVEPEAFASAVADFVRRAEEGRR